ncbi:MAG: YceI family protein [Cyclobacteriaceae bacterium]|nr:YceI family protein [Cyclobacteriaceae bacterium]
MKKALFSIAAGFLALATTAQTTWVVDLAHSKVNFTVEHLVISEVDGTFKSFDGKIITSNEDFSDASITFSIDVSSVNTDNGKRDGHLQSEDFFYVEKHPKMIFESTYFTKKSGNQYVLKGNLTMRGVTKPVEFSVKYGGQADDGYGNTKAGFIAKGSINRMEFGVAWNAKTKQGGWTVGEEVELLIKLEMIKK